MIKKYLKVWYLMTINGMAQLFQTRVGAGLFITGKIFRFVFFLILLVRVVGSSQVLAGYSLEQMVFFFLTFNLIDTASQMFFRGVYLFRRLVVSGDFDLILTKPLNPLFRVIFSNTDLLDFSVLVPLVFGTAWYVARYGLLTNPLNLVGYILLVFNGILIALALHIFVVALAVATTEIDSTIMLYRDLTSMARVPVDLYREPLRGLITFAVPVGLMMTVPAKALFGLLSGAAVLATLLFSALLFLLSVRAWRLSLRHYTSASS
jgi:ABC-2 type transport system permease protein